MLYNNTFYKPSPHMFLDVVTLITVDKEEELWSSSLSSFVHLPFFSSLLLRDSFISTLLSTALTRATFRPVKYSYIIINTSPCYDIRYVRVMWQAWVVRVCPQRCNKKHCVRNRLYSVWLLLGRPVMSSGHDSSAVQLAKTACIDKIRFTF